MGGYEQWGLFFFVRIRKDQNDLEGSADVEVYPCVTEGNLGFNEHIWICIFRQTVYGDDCNLVDTQNGCVCVCELVWYFCNGLKWLTHCFHYLLGQHALHTHTLPHAHTRLLYIYWCVISLSLSLSSTHTLASLVGDHCLSPPDRLSPWDHISDH